MRDMPSLEVAGVHAGFDLTAERAARMGSARELFELAVEGLAMAAGPTRSSQRFSVAYLAALRAGAAVVALGSPAARPRQAASVWSLLARLAPELAEWAAFFEAGAPKRSLVARGTVVVSAREADDLLRDAVTFVGRIGDLLGFPAAGLAQMADRLAVSS